MDVLKWKVSREGLVIAQVSTFLTNIESRKVIAKALDGTIHMQTIGTGIKKAEVEVHCTMSERSLVILADADAALIEVVYRDNKYYGYIEESPEWETLEAGEMYKGTFTLLIEEVVHIEESTI